MWVIRYDLRAPAFGTPAPELYAAALEQCSWADEHGVEQVLLSDHHGVDDGYLPSPLVFAGAVAACTRHARLRIAAVVLTLRDPIATAEDVVVLDHVSGGRIEVICAAGYVPLEFRMFGVDFDDRAAIFEEKVELFTRALTGEPFNTGGRSGRVTPPPVQRPRPPVLLGGGTPRARRAARMADGFMPTGPDPALYELYTTECARLGKTPNLTKPEGALFVHVTEDPDRAWAEIAPHALHEMNSYGEWASMVEGAHPYEPVGDADALRAHGLYAVFTPDECVAYAQQLDPAAKLILHPLMAGLSPELAWESLELFAAKVLPASQLRGAGVASLTRNDLVVSHYTLHGAGPFDPPRFGFEERVAAAAAAGFQGIGYLTAAYEVERAAGLKDADMRAILEHYGLTLGEIEFLWDWSADPDDAERATNARQLETLAWAMADAFEPRVVSVGELAPPEELPPHDVVVERFGALCDRAAEHGLLVALEFMPWTGIPDAAMAGAIAVDSGRANGGINADTWHHFRGAGDAAALREHAQRVFMVQLDDADAEVEGELIDDTLLRRRYPGEGSFDIEGYIHLLDDAGTDVPLSVEILSSEHQALPVEEAARRAHDSTRAVVDAARSRG